MSELRPFDVDLRGHHLVEASAGTGKTFTIATLVLRMVLEQDLTVDQILVVTFTRAATAELRERVRARLHDAALALRRGDGGGDEVLTRMVSDAMEQDRVEDGRRRLERALALFDEAPILTIHGFCQRVLAEHAFESGASFDVELLAEQGPLIREIAQDFVVARMHQAPEVVVQTFRKKLGVAGILGLANRVAGFEVDIRPESIDPCSIEELTEQWQPAYEAVVAERGNVDLADLLQDGSLSGRSHQPKWVSGWIPRLDQALRTPAPLVSRRFEYLSRFSSSSVRTATKKGSNTPEHPFLDRIEELCRIETELEDRANQHMVALKIEFVGYLRDELRRRKAARQQISYDDLLAELRNALRERSELASSLRRRYPAALIDEFQDTDPVQYEIFSRIYDAEDTSLFLIGDPKQAIYGFRGADVYAYLDAARRTPHRWTLPVNYRSDPSLVNAVNHLFERVDRPFYLPEIEFHPVRHRPGSEDRLEGPPDRVAPLQIRFLHRDQPGVRAGAGGKWIAGSFLEGDTYEEAIAAEVARALDGTVRLRDGDGSRALRAGDVAILTRTNLQARRIQARLRELGLPCVMQTDSSVFETQQAVEFERILRALAAPGDQGAVTSALATPWFGLNARGLVDVRSTDAGWDRWLEAFRKWNEIWRERGFVPAFQTMLVDAEVVPRALGWADGERRVTDLLHLAELLQRTATEQHLGMYGLVHWMAQVRLDLDKRRHEVGEDAQVRLESDEQAVQLTSVHRSKGLEYPVVVLPHLWDGKLLFPLDRANPRFHDPDTRRLTLHLGPEAKPFLPGVERETFAENLRLLYVAITRARHQVIIGWGGCERGDTSALGYLLHGPSQIDPGGDPLDLLGKILAGAAKDDVPLLDDLAELEKIVPGLRVSPLPLGRGERVQSSVAKATVSGPRVFTRKLSEAWRTTSFSRLVRAGVAPTPGQDERDHDGGWSDAPPIGGSEPTVPLASFPAGARAGDFFHRVLELVAFDGTENEIRSVVEEQLPRFGFEREDPGHVTSAVASVLRTSLQRDGPRLSDIKATERLVELEFTMPVAHDGAATLTTARRLADALRAYGNGGPVSRYADRAARLGFPPLRGFLRGFVDLVFRYDGRFYVADHKSNRLGATFDAYEERALTRTMVERDYVLQYLLYTVAVHRHLRSRLPDYDYERDFGGVLYLFLRGMSPRTGPTRGVFSDRPPVGLVEALSDLLTGDEGMA